MRLTAVGALVVVWMLSVCEARPEPPDHQQTDLIPLTPELGIKLFPFPHLTRTRANNPTSATQRVGGFFADNPLISVKRSFQEIQNNVERSMQSLMAAGSEFGQRMLGMITRTPRLLLPPSSPSSSPSAAGHHHAAHADNNFPDFQNCDCHFGPDSVVPAQFKPYNDVQPVAPVSNDIESYGAPAAPVLESYGSPQAPVAPAYEAPATPATPALPNYEAPAPAPAYSPPVTPSAPSSSYVEPATLSGPIVDLTNDIDGVETIDGEPVLAHEPVIHPGGSQDVDYNKVSHIGVQTVVQAASAQVPDQSHPEKYLNHNHDHLLDVVHHNLWRKETFGFKHHHHGEKLRVIPHLTEHNNIRR